MALTVIICEIKKREKLMTFTETWKVSIFTVSLVNTTLINIILYML